MSTEVKRKTPVSAKIVKLRPENLAEQVLGEFVDRVVSALYPLHLAFAVGKWVWATDGRRMARAVVEDRIEGEAMPCPPFLESFAAMWSDSDWASFVLPEASTLTEKHWNLDTCPYCFNRRVPSGVPVDQVQWTKYGEIRDKRLRRLDYDVDDATIRDESCRQCRGVSFTGPNSVRLFGTLFDYRLLYPLRLLGEIQVAETRCGNGVCFRGCGVEGIVLGMAE